MVEGARKVLDCQRWLKQRDIRLRKPAPMARLAIVGTKLWAGQMAAPALKGRNPTVSKVSFGSQIAGFIRFA
jgi:hypothetical protein